MLKKLNQFKTDLQGRLTKPTTTGRNGEQVLALDIGTENVKALIAQVMSDGQIKIISSGRYKQGLHDMESGAISDIQAVIANCDQAIGQAEDMAGFSPRLTVVGIAGELIKGITNTLNFERPEPELDLSVAEVDQLFKQAQSQAYDQAMQEVAVELNNQEVELKLINSALVGMKVDGHPVTNPIGFQGKNVEIQMYTAFSPLVHVGAIEKTVRELDLELLSLAAEPFAVSRALIGNQEEASDNLILIDVGGGTTDIAVLRDGGLEGTRMFGIGGRAFTRSIARELSLGFEQAEKIKLNPKDSQLSSDQLKLVERALAKTTDVWIQGVALALSEFDWLDYLPHKIYLCGGGSSLAEIKQALESADWQKDLPFSKIVEPNFIQPSEVADIKDASGTVKDHTLITALGLSRVAADTMSTVQSRKSRLNKVLEN